MGNTAFKEVDEIPVEERAAVFNGNQPSLNAVAELIRERRVKNIVALCGAGVSVSAGIPDFRTPGVGLYDNLQKYDLPDGQPEAIFDLDFFRTNPTAFYTLAKELYPGAHKPTPCHHFLALLHEHGVLRRVYTQNIDGLERLAGLPEDVLVECHGTFNQGHCIDCNSDTDPDAMHTAIMSGDQPKCVECGGLCKPRITFFGEPLPLRFNECRASDFLREVDPRTEEEIQAAKDWDKELIQKGLRAGWGLEDKEEYAAEKHRFDEAEASAKANIRVERICDLLLVMGTSLKVAPVKALPDEVHWLCPRVLLNNQVVHLHGEPPPEWPPRSGGDNGFRFNNEDNYRDVLVLGDCDTSAQQLADLVWPGQLAKRIAHAQTSKHVCG
mmetsp:Transcript_151620/g.264902  ORF Transcript_151620/g.264902 Transcript_151620/m.264902 type:complete len:383 (-) Transcript_151620:335-1483(-)